jgi:hypothetical protein
MFIVWICVFKFGTKAPSPAAGIWMGICIAEKPGNSRHILEELECQLGRQPARIDVVFCDVWNESTN